jgi:hypothetical protein
MTFDPKAHLIQLPRKVKDKATGQYITVYDDYLEVKWRLVVFREKHPHGSIITETILLDWDKGVCIHRAHVGDGEGGMATGTGSETRTGSEDFVERSETRAIGRALAAMGIGTQFVGAELDELPHVADAPVTTTVAPDAAHETTGISHPLPVGEGGTAGAPTTPVTNGHKPASKAEAARMSDEAIAELFHLALELAGEDKEAFGTRLRRAMKLKEDVQISKRFVREHLSPEAYRTVHQWYTTLYTQLQRKTEVPDGTVTEASAIPQPAPATTEEAHPAVPSPAASSSAGSASPEGETEVDAAERDRQRLRKEVAQWDLRVPPEEIEHVIQHNVYSKARALLWNQRRKSPAATPIEGAAAD